MKTKFFVLSLIAAMSLTGCSTDDDLDNGKEDGSNRYGYVAVNIVQPKSTSTRVNSADDFEDGTEAENTAQTGMFYIFDSSGKNMYGAPQEIALSGNNQPTTEPPYEERLYNAVLVIDGVKDKPTNAYQIVCVLNAPASLKAASINTLTDLKSKIGDYSNSKDGEFIMSNSVYYNNNPTLVTGAIVTSDKIKSSPDQALANPVEIYVERVVAKIRAQAATTFQNNGAPITVDGKQKQLTIKVTGIEVANIAQKAYLLKKIDNSITNLAWNWSNPGGNYRSYWEIVPEVGDGDDQLTFGNKSYTEIVNKSKPATGGDFDIATLSGFQEYVQPNTCETQKTAILVTAQLLADGQPFEFVYLRGGYFTNDEAGDTGSAALNLIAEYVATSGYWKKTGTNPDAYTQLSAKDFEWKNNEDFKAAGQPEIEWLERYEVVATVKSTVTDPIYERGTDANGNTTWTESSVDKINERLRGDATSHPYVARVYKQGMCYYYVNIDQTPVANDNKNAGQTEDFADHTYDAVIRNHIYDLTLNSITGIGTPVFDPDDVIIPQRPDNESLWYLSARVNVLSWRLVKQTVDFQGM